MFSTWGSLYSDYVTPHSNTDTEPEDDENDDDSARMPRPSQVVKPHKPLTESSIVQADAEFSLL